LPCGEFHSVNGDGHAALARDSVFAAVMIVRNGIVVLGRPLELGLGTKDEVLLALTLLVGVITLGTGRTTVLQASCLVISAVFLFFAVVP
jgi:Ca2+/H+ antiporter